MQRVFCAIFSLVLILVSAATGLAQEQNTSVAQNGSALNGRATQAVAPAIDLVRKQIELAQRYTRLGRKQDAVDNAAAAAKLTPDWDKPWFILAQNLMDIGKYDDAAKYCKKAIQFNIYNEDAYAALTAIYFRDLRPFEAMAAGDNYLKVFPRGRYTEQVKAQIAESDRNRKNFLARIPAKEAKDSYLSQAIDKEGKFRWQASSMPLKVYVENEITDRGCAGASEQAGSLRSQRLRQAFCQWEQSSKGLVSFVYVSDAQSADINCQWKKGVDSFSQKFAGQDLADVVLDAATKSKQHGGETVITLGQGCIVHASINLESAASSESPEQIEISALHQIGHCLGIIGHSNEKSDLMHETNNLARKNGTPQTKLNVRDVNTLLALYQQEQSKYISETKYSMYYAPATQISQNGMTVAH